MSNRSQSFSMTLTMSRSPSASSLDAVSVDSSQRSLSIFWIELRAPGIHLRQLVDSEQFQRTDCVNLRSVPAYSITSGVPAVTVSSPIPMMCKTVESSTNARVVWRYPRTALEAILMNARNYSIQLRGQSFCQLLD